MVNYRSELEKYSLEIRIAFDEENSDLLEEENIPAFGKRDFFITGEKPAFKLKVKNLTRHRKMGIMIVTWHLGNEQLRIHPIGIKLRANEEQEYSIERDWLVSPQVCSYRLQLVGRPREVFNEVSLRIRDGFSTGDLIGRIYVAHLPTIEDRSFRNLCSYSVRDRAIFEHEERMRQSRSSHQKWMRWLTWAILVLTFISIVNILSPNLNKHLQELWNWILSSFN